MDRPETSATNTTNLCKLCNVLPRIYTCPRCGIGYCNMDCYKSEAHLECSESFYKQCVEEELKSQENEPESRQKMVEILKRLHDQELTDSILESDDANDEESQIDSDDDENMPDLGERLQNVNLDDADEVWSALTDSERQEFEALIKNGEVEKFLPKWVPWWTQYSKKKLVREIDDEVFDYMKDCPALINVPIFNEVQKASPNVYFNLTNVIYAYAYVALYYNGDYLSSAKEAAAVFLDICHSMKENTVFETVDSAIESVVQNIVHCSWLPQDEEMLLVFKQAAISIIQGPEETNKFHYISVTISELHRLLTAAKEEITKNNEARKEFSKKFFQKNDTDRTNISRKRLLLHCKKLEYYLSWVQSYSKNTSI